jgi:DNA-binding transcriptional LysR family regulator
MDNHTLGGGLKPGDHAPIAPADSAILRSGLKLIHLRLLVMIDDLGQVSQAANALNMTQPSASRMLTEMEAIMKCPLCRRASRGVVLTQFGTALARRGRKILLELREADREISQLKLGNGGTVHLGTVTAPAMSLVVPSVTLATQRFPGIEINIAIETSNILIRDLASANFDFVLGRIPDDVHPEPFNVHEIAIETACFAVRDSHPLLKQAAVTLEDMTPFDWVLQPSGTLLRRAVEIRFSQKKIPLPRNIITTPSTVVGVALLRQSDCIMPLSQEMANFVVDQKGEIGGIALLPIDFELSVRPYALITVKDRMLTPSAQMLYDLILGESEKLISSSAQL